MTIYSSTPLHVKCIYAFNTSMWRFREAPQIIINGWFPRDAES